jgi:hypothetical protein
MGEAIGRRLAAGGAIVATTACPRCRKVRASPDIVRRVLDIVGLGHGFSGKPPRCFFKRAVSDRRLEPKRLASGEQG